jgi:peptide/nickel transport system permease protein
MILLTERLAELRRYPSALCGLGLIALLLGISIYALIALPYQLALSQWRGGEHWRAHPINASPVWLDRIQGGNQPVTQRIAGGPEQSVAFPGGVQQRVRLAFEYPYAGFPSELNLFTAASGADQEAFVRLTWITPEDESIALGGQRVRHRDRISLSQNRALESRLSAPPHIGLFAQTGDTAEVGVRNGHYELVIDAILFGEQPRMEAELVVYGQVHGLAGTDHLRRDLMVALLWGTPIALAFGLLAAVGTTLATLVIAAIGVWFGGWIDALIQRLTEINMILPLLPVLVMIGALYSTSIWLMLGVVIVLGIFSGGIKMYRSMLLPIREAPYIEAARAYGASNRRIILRYLLPRVLPVLIPGFVTLIPAYVFLEASLAVLGLGDPVLPTWGKILNDAQTQSALYNGFYYWVWAPACLLMLTGLGFAMLGFALDRVFNPRLRVL